MPSTRKPDAATTATQVRGYMKKLPPHARAVLETMRDAIKAAVPDAEEHFSYGMPGFRVDGKPFIWYAAWKEHTSLYPVGEEVRSVLGAAARDLQTSRGTIRFPMDAPPSATLVKKVARARLAQMRAGRPVS